MTIRAPFPLLALLFLGNFGCAPTLALRPLDDLPPRQAAPACHGDVDASQCLDSLTTAEDTRSLGQALTSAIEAGHLGSEFLPLALSLNHSPFVHSPSDPRWNEWKDARLNHPPEAETQWIHIGVNVPPAGDLEVHPIASPPIAPTIQHADLLQQIALTLGVSGLSWEHSGTTWAIGTAPAVRNLTGGAIPTPCNDIAQWTARETSLENALLRGDWNGARDTLNQWHEALPSELCALHAVLANARAQVGERAGDLPAPASLGEDESCPAYPPTRGTRLRLGLLSAHQNSRSLMAETRAWNTKGQCSAPGLAPHATLLNAFLAMNRPDLASPHAGVVAALSMDDPSIAEWLQRLESPEGMAMRPQGIVSAIHAAHLVRHKPPHTLCQQVGALKWPTHTTAHQRVGHHSAALRCGQPSPSLQFEHKATPFSPTGLDTLTAIGDALQAGHLDDHPTPRPPNPRDDADILALALLDLAASGHQANTLLPALTALSERRFVAGETSATEHGIAFAASLLRFVHDPRQESLTHFVQLTQARLPDLRALETGGEYAASLGPLSRALAGAMRGTLDGAGHKGLLDAIDAVRSVRLPRSLPSNWRLGMAASSAYAWHLLARQSWALRDDQILTESLEGGAAASTDALRALLGGSLPQETRDSVSMAFTLWSLSAAGATSAETGLRMLTRIAGEDCTKQSLGTLMEPPSVGEKAQSNGSQKCKAALHGMMGHLLSGEGGQPMAGLLRSQAGLIDATRARRPRTHVLRAFRRGTAVPGEDEVKACRGVDHMALLGPAAAALATPLRRPAYTAAALARYTDLAGQVRGTPVLECSLRIPAGDREVAVTWTGLPRVEGVALPDRSRTTLGLIAADPLAPRIDCRFRTDPRVTSADRVNDRFLLATHALLGKDHALAHRTLVAIHQELHRVVTGGNEEILKSLDLNVMAWVALLARLHGHVLLGQDLDLIYLEIARGRGLSAAELARDLHVPEPLREVRHIGSLLPIVEAWTTPDKTAHTSTLIAAAQAISARTRLFPKTGPALAGSVLRASLGKAPVSARGARLLRRPSKRHPGHYTTPAWRLLMKTSQGKVPAVRKVLRLMQGLVGHGLHGEMALFASRISALLTSLGKAPEGQSIARSALGMLPGEGHDLLRARLLEGILDATIARKDPVAIESTVHELLQHHAGHVPESRLLSARINLVNAVADQRDVHKLTAEVTALEAHMLAEAPEEQPFLFALKTLRAALEGLHSAPSQDALEALHRSSVNAHPAVAVHADLIAHLRTLPPDGPEQRKAITSYLEAVFGWSP